MHEPHIGPLSPEDGKQRKRDGNLIHTKGGLTTPLHRYTLEEMAVERRRWETTWLALFQHREDKGA